MSPLSLLFSSDQETSRLLSLALREVGLEVELCPDIFTALERLTVGDFEIIFADWGEGPEAAFLMKTAREPVRKRPAFTIAIAKPDVAAQARGAGTHLVILKPFSAESVRQALLACEEFRFRYESCLPQLAETKSPSADCRKPGSHAPLDESPLRLGADSAPAFLSVLPQSPPSPFSRYARKPERLGSAVRWTARAAAIVVLGSAGYLTSQTTRSAALTHPMATMYHNAMGKIHMWVQAHDDEADDSAREEDSRLALPPSLIAVNPAKSGPRSTVVVLPSPAEPDRPAPSPSSQAFIPASLRIPSIAPPGPPVMSSSLSPAAPGAAEAAPISEDLSQSLLLEQVPPSYPAEALRSGLEGRVVLQAWIGRDGNICDLKVVRGPLPLAGAAYAAVKQWRYKPYLLNGQPMEAQTFITLNFKLPYISDAVVTAKNRSSSP